MQVLTVLAMERPVSFAAEDIRDEKVRRIVSNVISSSLMAFNPYIRV
jgi:glucose-6-phosphate 1-dehydrogenase